jgi:glycine/D-amino acid oxidase-like deaminating enzyme
MTNNSYLIVGSGVFGASTALHLIRTYPSASITLIDRDAYDAPTRVAASWDWNEVIRADYSDIVYTRLGLEAQRQWRTNPVWKAFYHESGVFWISPSTFAAEALKNYRDLGAEVDISLVSVEEARGLYDGLFDDADYTGVKEVLVNRSGGWAEAKEALQSTIEAAVELGVKYITAEVATLELSDAAGRRRCCGVRTAQGELIKVDNVILCTGAFTPKLLMDSAPKWTDLHAGDRILAAAITEAIAPLSEDLRSILTTMPVGINDNPTERGTGSLFFMWVCAC